MDLAGLAIGPSIVGGLIAGFLGTAWYGPLFGTPWMRAVGHQDFKPGPGPIIIAMVSWQVMSWTFAFLVLIVGVAGPEGLFGLAMLCSLGLCAAHYAMPCAYSNHPGRMTLWLIDSGYNFAGLLIFAAAHALWP